MKRWSVDCKATVKIGDFSRGGQTRGDDQAFDHDLGCKEKYTPCGIVDEDSAQLAMVFGSSYKTSDFIADTLEAKWNRLEVNWTTVKDWSEQARYNSDIPETKARDFYSAVTARGYGVLSWLRKRW